MNPIILIQKKLIRVITLSNYLEHTTPLFMQTKILPIRDLYLLHLGICKYKMHSAKFVAYPAHHHNTRLRNNALPTLQRLAQCQRSISYSGPTHWNTIPLIFAILVLSLLLKELTRSVYWIIFTCLPECLIYFSFLFNFH